MKSFSEIFRMVTEAPERMPLDFDRIDPRSIVNNRIHPKRINGEAEIAGLKFDLYRTDYGDNSIMVYFILNGETLAFYSGKYDDSKKVLFTSLTETKPKALPGKSLMLHVFTDYLLKSFEKIVSDNVLSSHGLRFWKNLMINLKHHPAYSFEVWMETAPNQHQFKKIKTLSDENELDNYLKAKYRFVISRKHP